MATGTLMPSPYLTVSVGGVPQNGALVNFYASGTSSRINAYSEASLTTPLSNPAACDSEGRLVAYFSATSYKLVITTALGVLIKTIDPVTSVNIGSAGLGEIFVFGSASESPITSTSYTSGATLDKIQPGSAVFYEDSANLTGTYVLEVVGLQTTAGTLTVALVNLDDGAPDTPLVTCAITSLTGERVQSSAISFAPSGAFKNYAIKAKVSANTGFVISARIRRTV